MLDIDSIHSSSVHSLKNLTSEKSGANKKKKRHLPWAASKFHLTDMLQLYISENLPFYPGAIATISFGLGFEHACPFASEIQSLPADHLGILGNTSICYNLQIQQCDVLERPKHTLVFSSLVRHAMEQLFFCSSLCLKYCKHVIKFQHLEFWKVILLLFCFPFFFFFP